MKHLVLGGGSIGKRHLNNLHALGEKELFCFRRCYDKDFEKEYQCKVVTGYDEVKQLKPDILYVCNPTSLHSEGLKWAQELGAHLFMEKPLTHCEQHLQEIILRWNNQHVFFIGYVLRYHPLMKIMKEKLDEGVIGKVFSARFEFGSYLPNWHPEEDYREANPAKKSLGGGSDKYHYSRVGPDAQSFRHSAVGTCSKSEPWPFAN